MCRIADPFVKTLVDASVETVEPMNPFGVIVCVMLMVGPFDGGSIAEHLCSIAHVRDDGARATEVRPKGRLCEKGGHREIGVQQPVDQGLQRSLESAGVAPAVVL
jgi:hypothetical protein